MRAPSEGWGGERCLQRETGTKKGDYCSSSFSPPHSFVGTHRPSTFCSSTVSQGLRGVLGIGLGLGLGLALGLALVLGLGLVLVISVMG